MSRPPTLPRALDAELHETKGRAGRLAYYVGGDGPPLLLIHSINAAASAYEVKPVYDRMRTLRRVYSVELPGYGHSDRLRTAVRPGQTSASVHARTVATGADSPRERSG